MTNKELVAKLTDKEREALRFVQRHLTSKEIAPLLGVGSDAIDARIKSACRKLGISDRGKAAMLLVELETEELYQQPVYQSPEIVRRAANGNLEEPVASVAKETQQPFLAAPASVAVPTGPASSEEERRNKLGRGHRLLVIAAVAIGTVVAISMLVSFLNGLVQLVQARGHLF